MTTPSGPAMPEGDAALVRELARIELRLGTPVRDLRAAILAALTAAQAEGETLKQNLEKADAALAECENTMCTNVNALRAQLDAERGKGAVLTPLARLGLDALDASRDGGELDGGEVQDKAEEYGVVVPTPIEGKFCGEGCRCEEYDADICYRDSEATAQARAALARDGEATP